MEEKFEKIEDILEFITHLKAQWRECFQPPACTLVHRYLCYLLQAYALSFILYVSIASIIPWITLKSPWGFKSNPKQHLDFIYFCKEQKWGYGTWVNTNSWHISKRCWAVIMSCILHFEPPLFLYFIYLIQIFEVNNGFNVGLIAIKLIWPLWYLLGIAFSFHTVIYLFISLKLHFPTIFLFCLKQNFL